jgi:serine/threonine protein kinase/Tfp pilus assembly protein PilF
MTPKRWKQIDELAQGALEREGDHRASFLDEACAGDEGLRREVESQIAYQQQASRFLEEPAFKQAAEHLGAQASLPAFLIADPQTESESMEGRTISHYSILRKLGAGGMGEVYLARDTTLSRKVAIKFLSQNSVGGEQGRKRLVREAKAAGGLDHPHICAVHEVGEEAGQHFIVMQYVEGETLASRIQRKPIEPREALDIAVQIADALAEAHSHRIIHRDIKPQNVMLTASGQVKVLDFGLARVVREGSLIDSISETESVLTMPGSVIGTVPYMSPEQVRGEVLDGRSDIFSFVAVLYEMLSGRQPFQAESVGATLSSILTKDPAPLARYAADVPDELQRIVRKALSKDKEGRYQGIKDLLVDLKDLKLELEFKKQSERQAQTKVGHPSEVVESLAVLPLANTSNDPNIEYLCDGITETIINSLSQLPKLKVMARSTVFRYKAQVADPQEIGRALGVPSVLTGRMLQLGDTLIIGVELVRVADGTQVWGEQYRRKLSDIFELQEEIAREVSEELRLKLSGVEKERLIKRYTKNTQAYDRYLKGLYYWNKRTPDGLGIAIEYFREAITIDPNYALAYAGLAHCYILLTSITGIPSSDTYPKAKAAAIRALEIDNALAEACVPLAYIKFFHDWDWAGAETEYKNAIEFNCNYATARHYYSICLVYMGRFDEAFEQYKTALQLDPLSLPISSALAWALYSARRYDEAIEQCKKTLEMDQNFARTHLYLGEIFVQKGLFDEAITEFNTAERLSGELWARVELAHAYAASHKKAEAEEIIDQLGRQPVQNVSPYQMAIIYAGLGEKDKAFELMEKAFEQRNHGLVELKVEPMLDSLRLDPRFADLLRRVGLS